MARMTASKAREEFSELLNRVSYRRERVVVHRHGKDLAALVPLEDLQALEDLEDRRDAEEAQRRLCDPTQIPLAYEQARQELGLE